MCTASSGTPLYQALHCSYLQLWPYTPCQRKTFCLQCRCRRFTGKKKHGLSQHSYDQRSRLGSSDILGRWNTWRLERRARPGIKSHWKPERTLRGTCTRSTWAQSLWVRGFVWSKTSLALNTSQPSSSSRQDLRTLMSPRSPAEPPRAIRSSSEALAMPRRQDTLRHSAAVKRLGAARLHFHCWAYEIMQAQLMDLIITPKKGCRGIKHQLRMLILISSDKSWTEQQNIEWDRPIETIVTELGLPLYLFLWLARWTLWLEARKCRAYQYPYKMRKSVGRA